MFRVACPSTILPRPATEGGEDPPVPPVDEAQDFIDLDSDEDV